MIRANRALQADLAKLADKHALEIEKAARAFLASNGRYRMFLDAMGSSCFYYRDGSPADYEALPRRAREIIDYCEAYYRPFGSSGVEVRS